MTLAVVMPALGESVTEGTVTRWLKAPGDLVEVGEPLLEVSTDKVDTTIDAPHSGVLAELLVNEDETAVVGQELALISSAEASAPAEAEPGSSEPSHTAARPAETAPHSSASERKTFVTPAVRALVRTHGTDISSITGHGYGGRVTKRDVLAALAGASTQERPQPTPPVQVKQVAVAPQQHPATTSAPNRTEKLSRLRATIATRMVDSLRVSAQLTTVVEADFTHIANLRSQYNRRSEPDSPRMSFLPFVAEAVCRALAAHPLLNATIDANAESVTFHDEVNLGIAVDTPRGLLVPVIRAASDLNIAGLARRIAETAQRTRDAELRADDLAGSTFTITNTGSRGALFDTPIINQPEVAILGLGAIVRRPIATTLDTGQEVLAIRSMGYLALTYDHRLVDGADAARFLATLVSHIESPAGSITTE